MNDAPLLIWSSASACHIGNVRKANEDACLNMPELGLWAVADGMGGHQAGGLASTTVIQHLLSLEPAVDLADSVQQIQARLQAANRSIREESLKYNQPIGSTVAVLVTCGQTAACIWAGDSRVYLHRAGVLMRLTQDHSMVQEQIAQGWITKANAQENPGANVITRAVGPEDELDVDIVFTDIQHGDTFAVCTDGLYKELPEAELAAILSQKEKGDPQKGDDEAIVQTLVDAALAHGGRDNLSVIVVRFMNAF